MENRDDIKKFLFDSVRGDALSISNNIKRYKEAVTISFSKGDKKFSLDVDVNDQNDLFESGHPVKLNISILKLAGVLRKKFGFVDSELRKLYRVIEREREKLYLKKMK